jgi:hypothetical protein
MHPERRPALLGYLAGGVAPCPTGFPEQPEKLTDAQKRAQRARIESEARTRALPGPDPSFPVPPPPGAIGGPEPAWLQLLRLLAETYRAYQDQRTARAEQERQRMGIADAFSSVASAVVSAAPAALTTYYNARAQEQAAKAQMRLAANYSGVPLAGVPALAGGALGMLLGEEPGVLEGGGVFERLGLEGDVERTATLWRRSATGFRPVHTLTAANPSSGSLSTWVNMGRPVLYTGDLSACKRVNRIAARVARVARRRAVVPFRRRKAR